MPVYDFKCTECEGQAEEIMSFRDSEAGVKCPQCGAPMKRIMSVPSHCKVFRYDLDYMGTPAGAEASARRCGVPT